MCYVGRRFVWYCCRRTLYKFSRTTLLIQPPHHVHVPATSGVCANLVNIPRAVVFPRQLQRRQVPAHSSLSTRPGVPRAALVVQPLHTSRCPRRAAARHVQVSHGHPVLRSHCNTFRYPPSAAKQHVAESNGQPVLWRHFSTSRCPPRAASEHASLKHISGAGYTKRERRRRRFFSSLAHVISAVAATAAAYPRPAPASEVGSRGPSRRSTSAQGLKLVHFLAQRKHLMYATRWEDAEVSRMAAEVEEEEEEEEEETAGWDAARGGIDGGG